MMATQSPDQGPYVGLGPFDAAHADYFFGRASESEVIAHNVLARPLTVLFGASGVGKSSVLNVGLPKALRELELDARIVQRREWGKADELQWLRDADGPVASAADRTSAGSQDPIGERLILVLDQFEEFLSFATPKRAREFARALARLVARRDLEVHVLFSLRDYGLHRLEAIRSELPHLLEGTLELRRLDEDRVREAIEGPLKVWNERHGTHIALDPDFTTTVIDQLRAADRLGRAAGAGVIDLSYLQLVLQKLWDTERAHPKGGFDRLRTSTLTKQLKGVDGIARAHVDDVLDRLAPQDQALCSTLVDRLITPSGGKVLYAATDLARVAKAPPGRMEAVAGTLATGRNRLLREVPLPGSTNLRGYEIQHEILAKPFLDWLAARHRAEAARRRYTWFAIQFLVFAAILLGLSVWLLDEQERAHREDFLTEGLAPSDEGRERRLLASLFLFWEQSGKGGAFKRADAIVDLEKRGRLPLDRADNPVISDLADAKAPPPRSSLLLACMNSWLERGDLRKARLVRDALDGTGDPSGLDPVCGNLRNARHEDADQAVGERKRRTATGEWGQLSAGSLRALGPAGLHAEVQMLLGKPGQGNAPGAPAERGTSLPVVHLGDAAGDAGARVVAAVDDLTVRLWNAPDGAPIAVRTGCEGKIFDVAVSRDGRMLAAACADGSVRLWDLACEDVEVLKGDTAVVRALAFSPDAKLLAAAARAGAVRIWRVHGSRDRTLPWDCGGGRRQRSEELRILRGARALDVLGLAFNPAGTCLVTASQDRTASVWDVATGRRFARLRGHSDWVSAAAFSPDGRKVVTASYDGTARLWNLAPAGEPACGEVASAADAAAIGRNGVREVSTTRVLQGHKAQLYSAAFGPDGNRVVTASRDGTVRIWNVGAAEGAAPALPGIDPWRTSAVFSADGTKVLAASRNGAVSAWDAVSGRAIGTTTLPMGVRRDAFVYPVHFEIAWKQAVGQPLPAMDERLLAFYRALFGANAGASDAQKNASRMLEALERAHPGSDQALAARIAWQGVRERRDRQFIAGLFEPESDDGKAAPRVLDAPLRSLVRDYRAQGAFPGPVVLPARQPNTDLLTSVAFSPDGNRLAATSYDGTVHFWERTARGGWKEAARPLEGFLDKLTGVAFSPDGKRFVTASYDGCARVWDWNGGDPQQRFGLQGPDGPRGRPEPVYSAQFSPDGKRVVTASRDGTARVWELEGGSAQEPERPWCRARIPGASSVTIALSQVLSHQSDPDPRCTAREDDGHEGHRPAGHHHAGGLHSVASAAFSGDGKYVVTGAADGCARIWDWKDGSLLQTLPGHTGRIHMVAFGPAREECPDADTSPGQKRCPVSVSVIAASRDTTARLWWDWHKPGDFEVLQGQGGEVYSAVLSPDGARVVTASEDGARVWVLIDGKYEFQRRVRSQSAFYGAAWEPGDGRAPGIALAADDRLARFWRVDDALDAGAFATDLNYQVACTLAERFPEIGCGKAASDNASDRARTADRLLAEVYAAAAQQAGGSEAIRVPRADGPRALRRLRSEFPGAARTLLAELTMTTSTAGAATSVIAASNEAATGAARGASVLERVRAVILHWGLPKASGTWSAGDLALSLVVWPVWLLGLTVLWPLRRWVRRKRGGTVAGDAAPDPVRRAWAGFIDVVIAVALGLAFGGLAGLLVSLGGSAASLVLEHDVFLGYRGWDLAFVAFGCVSSAYLLLRDAVKYQFRRSIGKRLFGLLPVTRGEAEVDVIDSVKRNAFVVVIWLLVLLPCAALLVWPHWMDLPPFLQPVVVHLSESPLIAPWKALGHAGFAAAVVGLTALGIIDLSLTCLADGRTLRDRIAGTKVVGVWAEQPQDASEGAVADEASAAAAPA